MRSATAATLSVRRRRQYLHALALQVEVVPRADLGSRRLLVVDGLHTRGEAPHPIVKVDGYTRRAQQFTSLSQQVIHDFLVFFVAHRSCLVFQRGSH